MSGIPFKITQAEEKGTTENKMVGWHHRLDGHEFEQAPGVCAAFHGVTKSRT